MIGRRTPSPIRVWRSWYRATFGSAVSVSGTGSGETPQSLATPAFAGFSPIAESGTKSPLTTGMTTDRKNFIFTPRRGIMEKSKYPGIAKLVSHLVWDQETGRSSRPTRTIMWRQKRCLLRKARIYRAFLLPKRRFFSVPKHRCKIAVFPLWIDLNSRKVNIRYTGR